MIQQLRRLWECSPWRILLSDGGMCMRITRTWKSWTISMTTYTWPLKSEHDKEFDGSTNINRQFDDFGTTLLSHPLQVVQRQDSLSGVFLNTRIHGSKYRAFKSNIFISLLPPLKHRVVYLGQSPHRFLRDCCAWVYQLLKARTASFW